MEGENQDQEVTLAELTEETISEMSTDDKREALQNMDTNDVVDEIFEQAEYEEGEVGTEPNTEEESAEQKIARLENENREWQLKHDRLGTEVGEKRKYLAEQKRLLEDSLRQEEENGFSNIASEGYEAIDRRNQIKQNINMIDQEAANLNFQENERATRNLIEQRIGEVNVDAVHELLIADGVPEQQARAMNPLGMPKDLAFNLFQRAQQAQQIKALQEENARLKGGGNVLQKVQKAAKQGGRVGGKAGNSASDSNGLTPEKVSMMSTDQKRALLKKINQLNRR